MIYQGEIPIQDTSHYEIEAPSQLRIHSFETFGTHDGPGIRMVVFVQGCQFRCLYCANPDTLDVKGGRFVKMEEIVKRAINQNPYFGRSGGVTVSGGEPLLQRVKLKQLFEQLHEQGIHTALDSNGRLIDQSTKELLEETDLLLLDIKHIDNNWHYKITGLSNTNTLKVAEYREKTRMDMWLRYVLVPGFSDQEEHLHQLGEHFKEYKTIKKIEVLPYHTLGIHKWEALGLEYKLRGVEPPSEELKRKVAGILEEFFVDVVVR
jgi:pyruvate formate lyase activating enzyme